MLKYVKFCYRKETKNMFENLKEAFDSISIKTKQKLFLISSSSVLSMVIIKCFDIVATAA